MNEIEKISMNEISIRITELIQKAREHVVKTANTTMVFTYYQIGSIIVEEWQKGELRAEYGSKLLQTISNDLTIKFGKGFSVQNLERMRNFFGLYSNSSKELRNSDLFQKSSNVLRISNDNSKETILLPISWSHYLFLMRIENELERQFYEIESHVNQWKLKELERQFNSGLFERLSISKDKAKILQLAKEGQIVENVTDLIKDPLVLEFLGLEDKNSYSETELESAIINEIENFMLELGKGFFFGGRQVRFTFEEDHFFVDLVFYNRILKCFVLVDLKIGKLAHQDLGQMQMYVNYYDRFVKDSTENPTIGIVLSKVKNQAVVEITLPEGNRQIFASKYQTILPTKESLQELLNHYETDLE
jgi:predicted nuclease of restriction endonuclease-like (RecB) superfamily